MIEGPLHKFNALSIVCDASHVCKGTLSWVRIPDFQPDDAESFHLLLLNRFAVFK
jgi:hypothetical protein